MWITPLVIHIHLPGNRDIQSSTSINRGINGENQRAGHIAQTGVVDNSQNGEERSEKTSNNSTAHVQQQEVPAVLMGEISALKADLSTLGNADKQRGNSSFSQENEQSGHASEPVLWKTEKLSTITVDNIYAEAKNNPFKAGMLVKKHLARGLDADNERMLFSMMVKLDFKCEKDVCEIRVMDKLAQVLENNIEKIQKHCCGFKVKIIGIETFTQSTQVEVDKIKKYFGEDYVKIVATL